MNAQISLADTATRDDLRIFLDRLLRVGQAEVRMVSRGSALAVFGCTQMPSGITDQVPVVLVMRAFELRSASAEPLDETVQARALLDRIARLGVVGLDLDVPDMTAMAAWAGVLPPVGGWEPAGAIDADSLRSVATEGIDRVAAALPDSPGEAVVRQVRSAVWGAEIAPGIPAAVAFAAESLGLIAERPLRVSRSLTWVRLTSERGHVLVRSLLG
ncbi:hypothetical protein [Leucobacter sp. GX24907]